MLIGDSPRWDQRVSDSPPHGPSETSSTGQERQTNTARRVSRRQLGTTQAGAPRRRIQWTNDMNEFIVRLYYRLTKCETQITGYRQNLREAFAHQYPTLTHVTEQNIADRRAAIFRRNLIPESRRNEIKDEV